MDVPGLAQLRTGFLLLACQGQLSIRTSGGLCAQGSMPLIGDVLSEEFFNGNSLLLGVEDGEYFHG